MIIFALTFAALAIVFFAFFDVTLYNLVRFSTPLMIKVYRVFQHIVLVALAVGLMYEVSVPSGIAFLLMWWTWVADLVYYFLYDLFLGRSAFKEEVLGDIVTWAWWTPLGLLFVPKGETINGSWLLIQSVLGLVLSIGVCMI